MATKSLGLTKFSGVVRPATAELNPRDIVIQPQVRSNLGDLSELRDNIDANGIQIRIIVSVEPDGTKELIAGERRLRCALDLGLPLVPAELKYDLTPYDKRRLQITENRERADLSPFDEVMGIARDVEAFGNAKAIELWGNKSKAWLSKRTTAARFPEDLIHLLQHDIVVDIELLGMLSQLRKKDLDRYAVFLKRIRGGKSVSREEVRLALDRTKERQEDEGAGDTSETPSAPSALASSGDDEVSPSTSETVAMAGRRAAPSAKAPMPRGQDARSIKEAPSNSAADVDKLRDQICSFGRTIGQSMKKLEAVMAGAALSEEERDFARWVALVDAVVPILSTSSKANAKALLNRLQRAMANRDVIDVWEQLHLSEGDVVTVPRRPDDWEH